MNLLQFLERWPEKEGRVFLLSGGDAGDRTAIFYSVCDRWRAKVNSLDFIRLHNPTLADITDAALADPIASSHRVVACTEASWDDPTLPGKWEGARQRGFDSLTRVIENLPRDLVLIISSPTDSPNAKNDLAQVIIRKGYWVALKSVDELSATDLVSKLDPEIAIDEDLTRDIVSHTGTGPASIIQFLRTIRATYGHPTPDQIRTFLTTTAPGTTFDLVEAIVQKDEVEAFKLADSPDVSIGKLVGALDRKFVSLVQFTAELKKGRTPKEAALALRFPGFIIHGLYNASKRWHPSEIIALWPVLAEASAHPNRRAGVDILITRCLSL